MWQGALAGLPYITPDDQALHDGACVIGEQITRLRPHFAEVFEGLSRSMAVMLIAAFANREFQTVSRKSQKAIGKATKDGPKHIELLTDIQLKSGNPADQQANADSAIESTVDALPHALFHANKLEEFEVKVKEQHLAQRGANIMSATSLERAYRILWQNCLWSADIPRISPHEVLFEQSDFPAESRWHAWMVRNSSVKMEGGFSKGLYFREPTGLKESDRIVKRAIKGIERREGRRNGPIIGPAKGWSDVQRHLVAKWITLEQSYLASFSDAHLPNAPNLSIRLVARAWWVLGELCEVLIDEMGQSKLASMVTLRRQSFPIKRGLLIETLAETMEIETDLATELVNFLTVDTSDLTRLFNRGFWGAPILKAPRGENVYLISPVIVIGDWVRAAEYWLELGGGTDGVALRGPQFEIECRETLAASLVKNTLLSPTACPLTGLPQEADGEEIDCLVRIGRYVLVCECKCLLTPTEAIERYNFIERLNGGCEQAARKAAWLKENPAIAATALGCTPAEAATFNYQGLVITNQTYGCGHIHADIPVVDLTYLDLICAAGSYLGDTIYDREEAAGASLSKHLYASQAEFERRLQTLLRDPVVMRRFADRFEWIRFPVLSMSNVALVNTIPVLKELDRDRATHKKLQDIIGPSK